MEVMKACSRCPHEDYIQSADPFDVEVRKTGRVQWTARFPWAHHKAILGLGGPSIGWRRYKFVTAWTKERAVAKARRLQRELSSSEPIWERPR